MFCGRKKGATVQPVQLLISPPITTTTALISGLPAGTYTVKAYVTNGGSTQTYEQSITINNTYKPIIASSTVTKTCPGGSSGTITVATSQGVPASYEIISAPAAYTNPLPYNQTSNVFTGLQEGVYQIRVYDVCGLYTTVTNTVSPAPNLSYNNSTSPAAMFRVTGCSSATYQHNAGHWAFPVLIETTVKQGTTTAGAVIATTSHTYNVGDPEVTPAGTDYYNIKESFNFVTVPFTFPIRLETKITDACGRVYNYSTTRYNDLSLRSECDGNGFNWDVFGWSSPNSQDRDPNLSYPITISWVNTANPSDTGSVVENTNIRGVVMNQHYI